MTKAKGDAKAKALADKLRKESSKYGFPIKKK